MILRDLRYIVMKAKLIMMYNVGCRCGKNSVKKEIVFKKDLSSLLVL